MIPQRMDLFWCREGGSNPHDRKGRRILSPLRLPVPPSRPGWCAIRFFVPKLPAPASGLAAATGARQKCGRVVQFFQYRTGYARRGMRRRLCACRALACLHAGWIRRSARAVRSVSDRCATIQTGRRLDGRCRWAARLRRERKVRTPQGSVPDNVRDWSVKALGRQVPQKTNRPVCKSGVRVKRCGKSAPRAL